VQGLVMTMRVCDYSSVFGMDRDKMTLIAKSWEYSLWLCNNVFDKVVVMSLAVFLVVYVLCVSVSGLKPLGLTFSGCIWK
jgi:hypothetical protein